MDLLDRYLRTVRSALPGADRDDITRELRENLRDHIDDREADLGRPLTDPELQALLASFGHPLAVASHFRVDQPTVAFGRQLIGPVVFPVYLRVLGVALGLAAAASLVGVLLDREAWSVGVAAMRLAAPVALTFVAITLTFTGIDRYAARSPITWDPGSDVPLPSLFAEADAGRVRGPLAVRLAALGELVVAILALGLWIVFRPWASVDGLVPAVAWVEPYPYLLVPVTLGGLAAIALLVAPARRGLSRALRIAADLLMLALVLWSLWLGTWLQPAPGATPSAEQTQLASFVNTGAAITLAVTAVILGWSIATEMRTLQRERGRPTAA